MPGFCEIMVIFHSFCFTHEAAIYWLILISTRTFNNFCSTRLDLSKVYKLGWSNFPVQWLYSSFLVCSFCAQGNLMARGERSWWFQMCYTALLSQKLSTTCTFDDSSYYCNYLCFELRWYLRWSQANTGNLLHKEHFAVFRKCIHCWIFPQMWQ